MITLAILEVPNPWDVGVVEINEQGRIQSFVEKPPHGSEVGNLGSGGIYILEEDVLSYIPNKGCPDFAYDIFPQLIKLGVPIYGYLLNPEDYLLDIGTMDQYHKANEDIKAGRMKIRHEEQSSIPR